MFPWGPMSVASGTPTCVPSPPACVASGSGPQSVAINSGWVGSGPPLSIAQAVVSGDTPFTPHVDAMRRAIGIDVPSEEEEPPKYQSWRDRPPLL